MILPLCDWCDRNAVHRHYDESGEVLGCHRHYTAYLTFLQRKRVLASRR